MGSRERSVDAWGARGRALTAQVLTELRNARMDRDLGEATIAAALGVSPSQYSRIERGLTRGITIEQATVLLASVGLELAARVSRRSTDPRCRTRQTARTLSRGVA